MPHGVCSKPQGIGGISVGLDGDEHNVEAPATLFRHTYMQENGKAVDNTIVKNVQKDKNARQHIRLRPRQMLCNKCKAMCQETDKGIIPITAVSKPDLKSGTNSPNKQLSSPAKEGLRKRPSNTNLKCELDINSKPTKTEKSNDKTQMINTKASPFIKINIGASTVLKIPPRFHSDEIDGSVNKGDNSKGETVTENQYEDSNHRKVKKLKVKDRDKEKCNENNTNSNEMTTEDSSSLDIYHHKKHKRKHKRRHEEEVKTTDDTALKVDENNDSLQESDSNQTLMSQRPRLLYTWRQNKGLSPRRDIDNTYNIKMSPQQNLRSIDYVPRKEYRLRSREKSVEEGSECVSSDICNTSMSESDDNVILSAESGEENNGDSYNSSVVNEDSQSSVEDNEEEEADGPPADENIEVLRPLMMKIQTRDVTKCIKSDGRTVHVGDIVWGKIKGFPWWPGRVLSITVSSRESGIVLRQLAHLAWFGSSTMSHIQCSDLYPFLEDFKLKYNKKKRGPYKMAIKQATIAAQSLTNTHHIDFSEYDL